NTVMVFFVPVQTFIQLVSVELQLYSVMLLNPVMVQVLTVQPTLTFHMVKILVVFVPVALAQILTVQIELDMVTSVRPIVLPVFVVQPPNLVQHVEHLLHRYQVDFVQPQTVPQTAQHIVVDLLAVRLPNLVRYVEQVVSRYQTELVEPPGVPVTAIQPLVIVMELCVASSKYRVILIS
ncbi:MAG: hypothetical protein ABII80_02000, partial [bacterium]